MAFTHTGPNATGFVQPEHMFHLHLTAKPQWSIAVNSDRKSTGFAPVGAIDIVPAGSSASASWNICQQSLRVDIDQARLKRLAGTEFDNETFELRPPKLGFIDVQLHTVATWAKSELEGSKSGELLDAIVTIYSIHLLRTYSTLNKSPLPRTSGGLSSATLKRVTSYIQENLAEHLSLELLAEIARLSPSHFNRSFKKNTGQTPHQFIIAARMARARDLILKTDTPFNEIAKEAGFAAHTHMAALMRREWGVTPSEIRRGR
ncbi:AraC family transcriptional regulator [Labrys sp. ZIDIC5]|uniref:AraC family transcriptional regulator n=1 Tax=Labrys sedimenti TaxID=3106036 RepID=UPI002AC9FBA3|nr:AraC family transcriptional regulator [Labrys sp. ZIDIC5]MDZ5454669.1 AraC family transcriptional regulator [Labrys sp. ZIDIC5]